MAAKKKPSKGKRLVMAFFRYTVASVSAAIFLYVIFALLFSTSEEKRLQKENRLYSNMYGAMVAKTELIGDVLDGLLEKDDTIYRTLFDTPPPSLEDIGGYRAEKEDSEALPERYYVKTASEQSDSLMLLAARIDARFDEIFRALQEKVDSVPPLSLPLRNMSYVQVGASIGMKHNPVYDLTVRHEGLDLVAPQGAKVYAAAAGKVSHVVRSRKGLGNEVTIDHGNGYETKYSLLGDISVVQGRNVVQGQEVGTVGISTSVAAPHLHFEVRYKGEVKDPIDYFFASLSPEDYARMRFMAAKTGQSMD